MNKAKAMQPVMKASKREKLAQKRKARAEAIK